MAASKSVRQLVLGSGNIYDAAASGSGLTWIKFVNDQSFKEGAVIASPTYSAYAYYTIDRGAGKNWALKQPLISPGVNVSGAFYTSDPSTSRARGGSGNTAGVIVPLAKHFVYVAHLDSGGAPDLYVYLDTLYPEKGRHPYTKDVCYGSSPGIQSWQCPVDGTNNPGRICLTCGAVCTGPSMYPAILGVDLGMRLQAMDAGRPVV